MKKPATKTGRQRRADRQVDEFDRRDLGEDIRASGVRPIVVRPKSRPTSIVLEPDLVEQLRKKGAKRGLGYQTMLKVIVREHLDEY
jgi:predicted DNA binding CopG/RHH family protein